MKEGDLAQASTLAVKSVAAKRGLQLEQHGALWGFVSEVSRERRDKGNVKLFYTANALHQNFYENEMGRETVEIDSETDFQISS